MLLVSLPLLLIMMSRIVLLCTLWTMQPQNVLSTGTGLIVRTIQWAACFLTIIIESRGATCLGCVVLLLVLVVLSKYRGASFSHLQENLLGQKRNGQINSQYYIIKVAHQQVLARGQHDIHTSCSCLVDLSWWLEETNLGRRYHYSQLARVVKNNRYTLSLMSKLPKCDDFHGFMDPGLSQE